MENDVIKSKYAEFQTTALVLDTLFMGQGNNAKLSQNYNALIENYNKLSMQAESVIEQYYFADTPIPGHVAHNILHTLYKNKDRMEQNGYRLDENLNDNIVLKRLEEPALPDFDDVFSIPPAPNF